MQIIVDIPQTYLDAANAAPEAFAQEAKLAMAAKLFEMKRLSSGMAAALVGMDRVAFMAQLPRFGVALIDQDAKELASDVQHA